MLKNNSFNMFKTYFYLLLIIITVNYKSNASRCTVAQVCVTDLSQNECGPGVPLTPYASIFGCCPGCGKPSDGDDTG